MTKIDTILYEALLNQGLAGKELLDELLKEAENNSLVLSSVLIRRKAVSEDVILGILSEKLNIRRVNLKSVNIDKSVIDKVPQRIASYYGFMPVQVTDKSLTIAVPYPLDVKKQDEIRMQLGLDIEVVLATADNILEALKQYYGLAADTLEGMRPQLNLEGVSTYEAEFDKVEDIEKLAGDVSVIRLVNQIILEGWKKRATDIHIEPYRQGVYLRYRIDGLLYDATVPPGMKNFSTAIISRIKIMSNLNIVERRLPQDGRAVVKVQEQMLDLRISTIPTPFGESLVIRILPTQMLFSLEKLGLAKRELEIFEKLILKPHGIIFLTGPTGSGKTTTLYACLSRINTRETKIITIEDPIEYEMSGITQIQVQPEIGLDFARGLRSILRHDPDVIMVGEVRDLETAEIAIRVALTGHLVFSTLHTNDAASGITRLVDIGLEPYLVSSSVEAFIAQRLIRKLCPECKYEQEVFPEELRGEIARDLGLRSTADVKVYRSKGCTNCNFTGFFGRTAIYEIILIDDQIKDLIMKKSTAVQIKRLAVSKGMRTLRQDGWQKVITGITTPEEVMRVTSAEEGAAVEENKWKSFGSFSQRQAVPAAHGEANNRVYERLDSKVNLRYKKYNSQEEVLQQGYALEKLSVTKNISAGGLLLLSKEPMHVGSFLELKIELPDGGDFIECLAKVIRAEEKEAGAYNVAVCFLDLTSAQRARMDKFVEKEIK